MIVTSLGILTIGPSLKAGYQSVVDVVKGEEDGIVIRYLMYFKEDIIVSTGLTFILLLWSPVAMTLIEAEFNNGSILAKLMIAILISQIAMPIIGGFMVLTSSSNKERKKIIPTLREGIIHYSKNIYKYYILTAVFFCLIGVAVFMRVIMTIGISGSMIICYLLFSSRNL